MAAVKNIPALPHAKSWRLELRFVAVSSIMDSAYSSEKILSFVEGKGMEARICSKGNRGRIVSF
jgi:hypothetical protein